MYLRKYESGFWKAVWRSFLKRLRYQRSMSSAPAVDVHAEVEVVGETDAGAAVAAGEGGLEDVEALDDEDVGAADREPLVGNDVVDEVGVDGGRHLVLAWP